MKKVLYIEGSTGISGDMSVAALIQLGASFDEIKRVIDSLNLSGLSVDYSTVEKSGIIAGSFNVHLDEKHENHDHDMDYLHGVHNEASEEKGHTQVHNHDLAGFLEDQVDEDSTHKHNHDLDDFFDGHTSENHHHDHRNLFDVEKIIDRADTSDEVKFLAKKIFGIVADAESQAHGVPIDKVHFHEVGALDSIADILAFAVAFCELGIDKTVVTGLCEGKGTVRTQHGILPVPVPATVNILTKHGIGIRILDVDGELITPTGAAIAAAVRTSDTLPESFVIKKTGTGAGKRNYAVPSLLRMMLIETEEEIDDNGLDIGYVYKLETNIDDSTGETLGFVMEELFAAGAYDVHYVPVYMKKNRPGVVLYVVCSLEKLSEMEKIIYTNTTTIGIRRLKMQRSCLNRTLEKRTTSLGEIDVKVCELYGKLRVFPEYESVKSICKAQGIGFADAYDRIRSELM